jgi:hypothetical protein
MTSGRVTTQLYVTIRIQAPLARSRGEGSETTMAWVGPVAGLRYSPSPAERLGTGNGSLRLNLTQHGETHQVQMK